MSALPSDDPRLLNPAVNERSDGVWKQAGKRLKDDKVGMVGLAVVVAFVLLSILTATGLVASDWGCRNRSALRTTDLHGSGYFTIAQDRATDRADARSDQRRSAGTSLR